MNVLNMVKKNGPNFRELMQLYCKDLQATGAYTVTEIDWNPETEELFYSMNGPKANSSRNVHKVSSNVYYKFVKNILED